MLIGFVAAACVGGASAQPAVPGGRALVSVGSPTFHALDVLPGQTSAEITVPVSEAVRLQLQVVAPVSNPMFTVTQPSGVSLPLPTATVMDGAAMAPAIPGAALHTPWIPLPASGNWTVRVNFSPATVRTVIFVTALIESPYRASVVLGGLHFRQGTATAASLFVLSGENPVQGAAVTLTAKAPSGEVINLAPNDSATPGTADATAGDGLYTGALFLEEVGQYLFTGRAEFTAANGTVLTREAQAIAIVSAPKLDLMNISTSVLSGPGNCVAAVQVNLTTNLLAPGDVVAKAVLRGSNGRRMERTFSTSATAGTLPLTLSFFAADVRNELGVNGPYTVDRVEVVVTAANGTTLEGSASEASVTAAVTLASLCVDPVRVGPTATVTPVVSNGYISALNVSFPVAVTTGGSYRVSFRVTGAERQQVFASSQSPNLVAGTNIITAVVQASALQATDGPFQVESVLVLGPSGSASVAFVGNTTPFSRWQFTPRFRGDLNADGRVDVADRNLLLGFRNVGALSPGDRRDLDRSGTIDLRDVQLLQRGYCVPGSCSP
jgi:hypothetical protein